MTLLNFFLLINFSPPACKNLSVETNRPLVHKEAEQPLMRGHWETLLLFYGVPSQNVLEKLEFTMK